MSATAPIKPPCNLPLVLSIMQLGTDFVSITDAVNGIFVSCKQLSDFGRREWRPQNIDDTSSPVLLEHFSCKGRLNNVRTLDFRWTAVATQDVDKKHSLHVISRHINGPKVFRCSTLMLEVIGGDVELDITHSVEFRSLKKLTLREESVDRIAPATPASIKSMFPVLEDLEFELTSRNENTTNAIVALVQSSGSGLKRIASRWMYRPKLSVLVQALSQTQSATTLSCIEGFELEDFQQENDTLANSLRGMLLPEGRLLSSLKLHQSDASRDSTNESLHQYFAYAVFVADVRTNFLGNQEDTPLPTDIALSGKVRNALVDATIEMHEAAATIEAIKHGINPQSTAKVSGIHREAIRYASRGVRCWCFPHITHLDLGLDWNDDDKDEGDIEQHLVWEEAMAAGKVYPNVETISIKRHHEEYSDRLSYASELSSVGVHLPTLRQVNVSVKSGFDCESHFMFPSFMEHMANLRLRSSTLLPPLSYRIELSGGGDEVDEEWREIKLGCRHHISSLLSAFSRIEIVDSRDITRHHIFREPGSPTNLLFLRCFTSLVALPSSLLPNEVTVSYRRDGLSSEDDDEDDVDDESTVERIAEFGNLVDRSSGWTFTSSGQPPHNDRYTRTISYKRPTQKHVRVEQEHHNTAARNVRRRLL